MDIRLPCELLRPFREKEEHHRHGVGAHLQAGNPLSTGVAQDMRMLEEGKIHINKGSAGIATTCLKPLSVFWSHFRLLPIMSEKASQ